MAYTPVDTAFFQIPTLELARRLLGYYLVHEYEGNMLVGRIIETEAYQGPIDRAAHSFNNRKTKRTAIMYESSGLVYTYQMHTHTLFNVVSGPVGIPHAVLIRAIEPVFGMKAMQANRGAHIKENNLTNGPGKLTKAMCITMNYYGHDITKTPLYIAKGTAVQNHPIETGPRVGIANTGEAAHYPWRFYEKGNPFVSKYR